MRRSVAIVDYGAGNLLSVSRAFAHCGATPVVVADPDAVRRADCLVLPGVGAFRDGMKGLAESGLADAVIEFARSGRPLLGICLGMQMLASHSTEFGMHEGLNLIPGGVSPIPASGVDGAPHKIPFIGWVELEPTRAAGFARTALAGPPPDSAFYLVHSFHVEPHDEADRLAIYRYDGVPITAAIARDNVLGCQFHPEKSGPNGLRIIDEFLAR